MKFKNIRTPHAYTEILEQIYDAILRGDLRKGDQLPSERQIALQTGLSRTSVREAIAKLSDAGLLKATSGWGGGTYLTSIQITASLLGVPVKDETYQLIEFYEARNIIETAAAELTALRANPEQIHELEETVTAMEKLVEENPDDDEAYFSIDAHFHRLVVKCSGNSTLFDLYIPILRRLFLTKDLVNVVDLHPYGLPSMKRFVQAVKDRDPERAKQSIQDHVKPLMNMIHPITA